MAKAPPPRTKASPLPPPAAAPSAPPPGGAAATTRSTKTFALSRWDGSQDGEKIILYGDSGMGKTSLARLLPKPVFIGADDGGRKLKMPDGNNLTYVPDIDSFDDLRACVQQPGLFVPGSSLVIDTGTEVEQAWCIPWVFANIKAGDSNPTVASSIEKYGWGKGYKHVHETMRLLRSDLDALVRTRVNVCIICQSSDAEVSNAAGMNYLQSGPALQHYVTRSVRASVRDDYCAWADHVLRIGYQETVVSGDGKKAVGKVASTSTARHVFASESRHFLAKTRTLKHPAFTFETELDDCVWQHMFHKGE